MPIERITEADLLQTLRHFPPDVLGNDSRRSFFLGLAIAKHFMGSKWVDAHISPEKNSYGPLRIIAGDGADSQISTFKVVDFGEVLFNLQHTLGFDHCISRMAKGNIEAALAELDLGRMLKAAGVPFRFVEPQGRKGCDYDVEIFLPDGLGLCADAKCKVEAPTLDPNALRNTFNQARKQFPKDKPSAIFVKIPGIWFSNANFHTSSELERVAQEFFARDTTRVVSIKYYISDVSYRNKTLGHRHSFREISNPKNKFDPTRNWDIFAEPPATSSWNGMPPAWRRLLFFPNSGPTQDESSPLIIKPSSENFLILPPPLVRL